MRGLWLILAIVISVGLALAPVQAAKCLRMAPMATMDDTTMDDAAGMATPGAQKCPCCDTAAQCPMAGCPAQCLPMAPTMVFLLVPSGHLALDGYEPSATEGLDQQPPTPPPRA